MLVWRRAELLTCGHRVYFFQFCQRQHSHEMGQCHGLPWKHWRQRVKVEKMQRSLMPLRKTWSRWRSILLNISSTVCLCLSILLSNIRRNASTSYFIRLCNSSSQHFIHTSLKSYRIMIVYEPVCFFHYTMIYWKKRILAYILFPQC